LGGYDTVKLRDDITSLPAYAFRNSSIKEIVLPASIESIDSKAIMKCKNLEKISLEPGSNLRLDDDNIIIDCPSLELIDFSNAVEVSNPEFYEDCPNLEKVLLPDGANASAQKEPTGNEVVASLENALAPFQDRMKAAGFTYEIIMAHDELSQVEIFTNKDELSAEDRELLKAICDAIASAPNTGLDPDLKNQIANCNYSSFKQDFGNDYYVGSDKMELGYWENGGCLVFFTNN